MLIRHKRLFWFGVAFLAVGIAFLVFPPYSAYCESDYSHHKYCAAYEMMISFSAALDAHNGAITSLATIVISAFTATLWWSTHKLWKSQREIENLTATTVKIQGNQIALAKTQHFIINRPRLIVRHFSIKTADHIGHPTLFFENGAKIEGGLAVVNVGGSPATILWSPYCIYASNSGLPANAPYETRAWPQLLLVDQRLDVGESCATAIADTLEMPPHQSGGIEIHRFERGGWRIYVMGMIRYRDDCGAERFMGFCRVHEQDGRFRSVEDPDYEWED
jgi:hypothetical protein